ncbi:MAG: hypothetical protein M9921_13680 [Fimbriimonadaceae bacterium]|nr:hypothetical protein [Fimbriimonadaceae bacterium]
MRGPLVLLATLLLLVGCAKPKEVVPAPEPAQPAVGQSLSSEPVPDPASLTPEAREANATLEKVLAPSSPAADTAPEHYPGSEPVGTYAYQRTNGSKAVIDTWTRTTPASLDEVAAFYTQRLGVRETSHLEDQRILTGSRLDGTLLAVTLQRKDEATEITLVVSVPK